MRSSFLQKGWSTFRFFSEGTPLFRGPFCPPKMFFLNLNFFYFFRRPPISHFPRCRGRERGNRRRVGSGNNINMFHRSPCAWALGVQWRLSACTMRSFPKARLSLKDQRLPLWAGITTTSWATGGRPLLKRTMIWIHHVAPLPLPPRLTITLRKTRSANFLAQFLYLTRAPPLEGRC